MKSIFAPALALSGLFLIGCLQKEASGPAGPAGGTGNSGNANTSDPYKPGYKGPAVENLDFKSVFLGPELPYSPAAGDTAAAFGDGDLAKQAVAGSYVGIIPWDVNQCPVADRVVIYMDDEDDDNKSKLTSLTPIPGGLNDGNGSNTRFTICKVPGGNFKRLQTTNYAVFNFGDGNQSCANGGVNYEQRIDNEDGSNNNSWSGCCGNSDPDFWTKSLGGWMQLRFCYYPKDPNQPYYLSFPSWLGRNYGVFTEAAQDNPYIKSWGSVRSDDEDGSWDGSSMNEQILVGTNYKGTARKTTDFPLYFNDKILTYEWHRARGGTYTHWNFGKIKPSIQ